MSERRKPLILTAVVTASLVLAWLLFHNRESRPQANVILISIDTLRPDRMGVYGHRPMGVSTTPFLDELAREGAVFSDAVSTSSWTLPSHYALMTGLSDELHEMVDDRVPPPSDIPMLAEILKNNGYATGGFFSGPYLHPFFGFDKGFDVYESCMGFDSVYDIPCEDIKEMPRDRIRELTLRTEKLSHEKSTSPGITEKAISFVNSHAEKGRKPFFLFLHYFDVHHDYRPPPPYDRRFGPAYNGWVDGRAVTTDPRINPRMAQEDFTHLVSRYDGEVGWVDENIRRLFRGIEKTGRHILDDTLVIVTSDHGEEFFEHGLIGHRNNLFEEAVKIPLIIRFPGRIAGRTRVGAPARIYDIVPTISSLLELPKSAFTWGRSLVPLLEGRDLAPEPALLELTRIPKGESGAYTKQFCLRHKGLKLITTQKRSWSREKPNDFTGQLIEERHELYDLEKDSGEKENLFQKRRDAFRKMDSLRKAQLEELRKAYGKLRPAGREPARSVPDGLRELIEGAGYH